MKCKDCKIKNYCTRLQSGECIIYCCNDCENKNSSKCDGCTINECYYEKLKVSQLHSIIVNGNKISIGDDFYGNTVKKISIEDPRNQYGYPIAAILDDREQVIGKINGGQIIEVWE